MDEKDIAHDGLRDVMGGRVDGAKMVGTALLDKLEQYEWALWLFRIMPAAQLFGKTTEHIRTIARYRSVLPSAPLFVPPKEQGSMYAVRYLPLAGRLLIGLPFAMSGLGKLAAYGPTTQMIGAVGLPLPAQAI